MMTSSIIPPLVPYRYIDSQYLKTWGELTALGEGDSRVGWDDNNKTKSHHYSFSALKNELLKTAINLS